jgi:alkanesulfonate monooxygenase SsuD/methylene tetrahydromethanopterin reductase-like flavin-dependent oxidoreductase (luciferase family)
MNFGFWVPNVGNFADPELLRELGVAAERNGWDGFFVWDMVTPALATGAPPHAIDPVVVLSAVAMGTERIAIGPMITPVARRRPHKLARETVTLDRLSQGRLILGVGLGDKPIDEFEQFGEDPDAGVRADKLDEGLEILTELWRGEPVTFHGNHFNIEEATFLPTPVQQPRIPIWAAGHWPVKRPIRRAARWDGVFPIGKGAALTPADYRDIAVFCSEYRDGSQPLEIVHTEQATGSALDADRIAEYEAAGVTWWFYMFRPADDVETARAISARPPGPAA